ncbi:blarina toxin-like [Lycodopsis pacificus]
MGGMTRLLLLLWAGVTVGSVVDLQKRIIGGKDCLKEERGYHAFLTFTKGADDFVCGGSLIHEQWILTAAHCWEDGRTVKAVLGPHTDHPTTVEIELKPRIFEDKDVKGVTRQHDIMLLKLLKPVTDVEHVPLPVDCVNKPDV